MERRPVRWGVAKGEALMDESGTYKGAAELPDRNSSPDLDVGLRWSKLGAENAWKERK